MKINQMKFQKWVVIGAFIMAVMTFVFAYAVFATPFYPLSSLGGQFFELKNLLDPSEVLFYDQVGYNFFNDIQPFNRQLATFSLVFIVLSLVLFISVSHKRRRYYVFNYVSTGVYAVSGVAYGVYSIVNLIHWSGVFNKINFSGAIAAAEAEIEEISSYPIESIANMAEPLQLQLESFKADVPQKTAVFMIGIVVFSLIIVAAALLVFNCVWKMKIMKAEDIKFAEEDERIRQAQAEHAKALAEDM